MTWGYAIYTFILVPGLSIGYVTLGLWLTIRAVRRSKTDLQAIGLGLLVLIVFFVVPFADVIIGRAQFARLCERESKFEVYRVVDLERRFYSPEGFPRLESRDPMQPLEVAGVFILEHGQEIVFESPKIEKIRIMFRDKRDNSVISEAIYFAYSGGWLIKWIPGHWPAEVCKGAPADYRDIMARTFRAKD